MNYHCENCNNTLELIKGEKPKGKELKEYRLYFCSECGLWHLIDDCGTLKDFSFVKPNTIKVRQDKN